MLTGALGIRLLLLIGGTLPMPAPYALTSALERVEVTNDAAGADGFQLGFRIAKDAIADYGVLAERSLDPFKRVIVAVLLGVLPEVLIDGVITHQQFSPGEEPGSTRLSVTGRDVSVMLDLEERNEEYPNQPDSAIAARVIGGYAQYGLVPQPTMTTDFPIQVDRIPRQQETDLRFLQRLAQRNGFVFYVEPKAIGVNTAYFGPENRLSLPQGALTVNLGPSTNVTSLSVSQDGMAPIGTRGSLVEPFTKMSVPIPALPSLKVPPLARTPTPARRTKLARDTAQANPAKAALSLLAETTGAPDSVSAEGELDAVRYGRVLRARRLVGLRGAGLTHDGVYYVRRVTHSLERGSYRQRFSLTREGTGSLLPAVPT